MFVSIVAFVVLTVALPETQIQFIPFTLKVVPFVIDMVVLKAFIIECEAVVMPFEMNMVVFLNRIVAF